MPIYSACTINKHLIEKLMKMGFDLLSSEITSYILVEGSLKGHVHHGIERIFQIIEGVNNNTISPNSKPITKIDEPVFAIMNAEYLLGQPVGYNAMQLAIQKADNSGIGMVGVLNSSHLGILSSYSEIASKKNMIGICMSSTSPAVIAPGGNVALLGTNPLSFSLPLKNKLLTVDLATSALTRGEVLDALDKNTTIKDGCAVNSNGEFTNDPREVINGGGILPFDLGIKGFFINLLISILTGPLIGGVTNELVAGTRYMNSPSNKGDIFVAININKLSNIEEFSTNVSKFWGKLLNSSNVLRNPKTCMDFPIESWNEFMLNVTEKFETDIIMSI